jgi:uncharacterized membrane protein YdcZ (DUF606 family)
VIVKGFGGRWFAGTDSPFFLVHWWCCAVRSDGRSEAVSEATVWSLCGGFTVGSVVLLVTCVSGVLIRDGRSLWR